MDKIYLKDIILIFLIAVFPKLQAQDNAITLEQSIKVCTLGGAQVIGAESDIGSLEVGKFADMIVLDQNIFEIDVHDINDSKILKPIVGGREVYSAK